MSSRKVNITLTIKAAYLETESDSEAVITWKRGSKHIDTRTKPLKAQSGSALFNEKFQMKTALDYDPASGKFLSKKSLLCLNLKEGPQLGEAELDLSKYANNPDIKKDRLKLLKCADQKAYIEISIVAKPEEDAASGLKSQATLLTKQSTIPEVREDEEVQQELEAQEKALQTQLETLQNTLAQLSHQEATLKLESISVKVEG